MSSVFLFIRQIRGFSAHSVLASLRPNYQVVSNNYWQIFARRELISYCFVKTHFLDNHISCINRSNINSVFLFLVQIHLLLFLSAKRSLESLKLDRETLAVDSGIALKKVIFNVTFFSLPSNSVFVCTFSGTLVQLVRHEMLP